MSDEKARHEMKKGYVAQLGRLESRIATLTAILKRLPNICACYEEYTPNFQCVYCAARAALEKTVVSTDEEGLAMTEPMTKPDERCGRCGHSADIHCFSVPSCDHKYCECPGYDPPTPEVAQENERPRCGGCNAEIDPNVCGCGGMREGHSIYDGHPFIPMGCNCFREPAPPPSAPAGSGVSEEQLREWAAGHGHDLLGTSSLKAIVSGLARALLDEMADEARARDAYYEKDTELARCEGALAAERQARLRLKVRYQELSDGLVDMQRHRDAWRNYAYVGGVVPDDYLDGNKVDRQPTRIEALEAAMAKVPHLEWIGGLHVYMPAAHVRRDGSPDTVQERWCREHGGRCAYDAIVTVADAPAGVTRGTK